MIHFVRNSEKCFEVLQNMSNYAIEKEFITEYISLCSICELTKNIFLALFRSPPLFFTSASMPKLQITLWRLFWVLIYFDCRHNIHKGRSSMYCDWLSLPNLTESRKSEELLQEKAVATFLSYPHILFFLAPVHQTKCLWPTAWDTCREYRKRIHCIPHHAPLVKVFF